MQTPRQHVIIKKGASLEEIERVLEAAGIGKSESAPDLSPFVGILKIEDDPVAIQRKMREDRGGQ